MKGEGEVKLNMTVGKGEQVLKHNGIEGQEAICSQLQSLKDAWANMLMTAMSCHRCVKLIHGDICPSVSYLCGINPLTVNCLCL